MTTSAIALPAPRQTGMGFPWIAFLPLALMPVIGTSAEGMQRLLLATEWIFILLAVRRPIWVIAALLVSEATISNFFLFQAGDVRVSSRLVLTLVSVLIVAPYVLRRPDLGPNARSMIFAALAFVGITTIANAVASDQAFVFQFLRYIGTGVIILALIPAVVKSRDDLRDLGLVVVTIAAVSALVAVLQHYHFRDAPVYQVVPYLGAPDAFDALGGRALGLSESPIHLTNFLLFAGVSLLGVGLMVRMKPPTLVLLAAIFVTIMLALYFSYTRSWAFGAGAGLLAMALLYRGRFSRELWLLLLVAPFLFWFWADLQGNRYSLGLGEDSSSATRPVLWSASLNIALDNPLLGVGHDQFLELSPQYANRISDDLLERQGAGDALGRFTPHNDFLNVWLSFGLFAFFLYIGMILLAIKNCLAAYSRASDPLLKGMALGALGTIIAFVVNSLFHNYFDSSMMLWLLLGLSLALTKLVSVRPSQRARKWPETTP